LDDGRLFCWGERSAAAGLPAGSVHSGSEHVGFAEDKEEEEVVEEEEEEEEGGTGVGVGFRSRSDAVAAGSVGRQEQRCSASGIACVAGPGTDAPEPVAQIAAGGRHSLALTASGVVLAWGCNLQVG
jgi:hypothetical protein